MQPSDYNRGTITSAGLIRCSCHGSDITMSEFEQHSNSQIHRPAEYIFIRSIDMSLKVGRCASEEGRLVCTAFHGFMHRFMDGFIIYASRVYAQVYARGYAYMTQAVVG